MDTRGKLVSLFSFGGSRPETTSDALQALALALQPLFDERERVIADRTTNAIERSRCLKVLGHELRRAGLCEFNRLVEKVCRSYCGKYGGNVHCRFEVEDFVTEVLTLTWAQFGSFDPRVARFSTWFSNCILPRVYSDMRRRIDPSWGRPEPKTAMGRLARQEVSNAVRNLSLDEPSGTDQILSDRVADPTGSVEKQLIEAHCREYFLQAICQLSAAEQVLLKRIYVVHEAQKEIAESLGISPAAVSLRMKKIYHRLADLLGEPFDAECADTQFCEVLRKLP